MAVATGWEFIMQDKYNMTGHKLLWHLDRLNDYWRGRKIAPINVQLGITNGCNLDCIYCYGAAVMGKVGVAVKVDMPIDTITRFLRDAKDVGVRSISLVGEGENTIHPNFYEVLECTRNIGMDMGMATNGVALDEHFIKIVLESLVWLRFSVGGATREVYKKIHGRDCLDRLVGVVESAVATKRNLELKTAVGLQMVVLNDNICDIVPLARLGKAVGVDYLVIKPCSDTPDRKLSVPHQKYLELENKFREAESYASDNYLVVIKRDKFSNLGRNEFDCCRATNFVIQINAKGDVAPCGHLLGYRHKEFHMGNINEQSFISMLSSDRYWEVQRKVQTIDVNKECETNCLHQYMNKFLMGLEEVPQHINFV